MGMTATVTKERPVIFSAPMVRAILDGRKTQTRRVVKILPRNAGGESGRTPSKSGFTSRAVVGDFSPEPEDYRVSRQFGAMFYGPSGGDLLVDCPYGQPGDRLWVREAFGVMLAHDDANGLHEKPYYAADDETPEDHRGNPLRWRSPIHMPRWASRITLEVAGVRVERLQEISEADAAAEGGAPEFDVDVVAFVLGRGDLPSTYRLGYKYLWDSLNARRGFPWSSNPWVWVIEFKRVAE